MGLLKHVTSFPVQHAVDPTDHLLRALRGKQGTADRRRVDKSNTDNESSDTEIIKSQIVHLWNRIAVFPPHTPGSPPGIQAP